MAKKLETVAVKMDLTKKQRDELSALLEKFTVVNGNAAFKRLSASAKRVAIAKDVLAQIAARKYKARCGIYVDGLQMANVPEDAQLQEIVAGQQESCEVCGIGSVFMSAVRLGDNLTVGDAVCDAGFDNSVDEGVMSRKVREYFAPAQLALIETAFEKMQVGVSEGWHEDGDATERARKFGQRYRSDTARLKAIMTNIVENEGVFKP